MARFAYLICIFLCLSCASTPSKSVKDYNSALKSGQMHELQRLSLELDQENLKAIYKGHYKKLHGSQEWENASISARIELDGELYLLAKDGNDWKVECTTVGPYTDNRPEKVLLLAVHLINSNDFNSLQGLMPSTNTIENEDFSEEFKEKLRFWAKEISSEFCNPFEITADQAWLHYGSDQQKTLKMVKEKSSWKIKDLW